MSERIEQPPDSGPSSRRTVVRRAVVGGVVGAALLVGPVALANLIVPREDGTDQVEAADASQTSLINMRRLSNKADTAKAEAAKSLRTTTTTAPPTTTTTLPPTTTTTAPPTTTTTAPPPPTTAPPPPPPAPSGSDFSTWDALAQCEAGGNWSINTGNGYYGGLQFSKNSWAAVGGTGLPHEHSRETQIAMGQRLQAAQGWGAWPACSSKLGLR